MSLMDGDLLKESQELFASIVGKGNTASPYTFCLIVQALANGGEIDKAVAYLHQMVRNGYSPRMITCNVVLRVLCEEGRINGAFHVLVFMIKRDTTPSRFSFTASINEFIRQRRLLEALGVNGAAVKLGVAPHRTPRSDCKRESHVLLERVDAIA